MVYSGLEPLMPLIRPDVPQCPDITIEQYLVRTVRDFCGQSRIWKEWVNEVMDPDIETYPLRARVGEIVSVQKVQTDIGVQLTPLSYTLPGQEEDNINAQTGVVGYTFDPPATLHIQGTPTQSAELFALVSLKPTISEAQTPQWILERYEEALVNGALARLKMVANKPWSSPDYATFHKDMYLRGISAARIDELKKHTNTSLTIKPRPFGR